MFTEKCFRTREVPWQRGAASQPDASINRVSTGVHDSWMNSPNGTLEEGQRRSPASGFLLALFKLKRPSDCWFPKGDASSKVLAKEKQRAARVWAKNQGLVFKEDRLRAPKRCHSFNLSPRPKRSPQNQLGVLYFRTRTKTGGVLLSSLKNHHKGVP